MSIDPVIRDASLLTLVWLGYFSIHSLLASLAIKRWVSEHKPNLMPAYRLTYNVIAVILLAIPIWLMFSGHKAVLWQFQGWSFWLTNALAVLAFIGFMISLRYYDGQEFLGLRQLRGGEKKVEDQENLHISPLHRYVRHPWYTLALVLIWTRPMDSLMLVSAVLMTAYFFLGSRLEEQKLKTYYGAVYEHYMRQVPGLVPLPWKHLTPAQAAALLDEYRQNQAG